MNTQLCKTILEVVISLTIQSGAIIGAALVVSKWLGRRGAAHQAILLRSAIVAVLLCAALSFGLAGRVHPLISLSLPAAQAPAMSTVDTASPLDAPANIDQDASSSGSATDQIAPVTASAISPPDNTAVRETPVATAFARQAIPLLGSIYFAGAAIWLVGTMALLIWLLACQCHLFLIARRSRVVTSGPAWEALKSQWPEVSVRRPRLLASRAVKTPFIAGLWRPSIFVPIDFEERFAPDAIALVIAHELCHFRRRDAIWTLLVRLTRIALWIQPLAWLLERRLQDTFETLCDAEVIAQGQVSASRYADCLVGMAEHLIMPPALRAVGLGVVPFRSSLGKRVQAILSGTRDLVQPITPALRMAIAVGATTLALAGVLLITARIPSRAAASESPTSVVQEYLDDLSNGKIAQAYALFSPGSGQSLSQDAFQNDRWTVYPNATQENPRDSALLAANGLFYDPHATSGYRFTVVGPATGDPNVVEVKVYPPGITLSKSFTIGVVTVPDPADGGSPRINIDKTLARIDPSAPKGFVDQGRVGSSTYRVILEGVPPGQNQQVYLQIVDPNSKNQQVSGFSIPPGSPYLGVQYAPASNFKGSLVVKRAPADVVKNGMVVVRVVPGSPAASAGIQQYDIILEADGQSLGGNVVLLRKAIQSHKVGQPMSLVIYSHGKNRSITLIVGKAPAVQKQVTKRSDATPPWDPTVLPFKRMSADAERPNLTGNADPDVTNDWQMRLEARTLQTQILTLKGEFAEVQERLQTDRGSASKAHDRADATKLQMRIAGLSYELMVFEQNLQSSTLPFGSEIPSHE